MFPWRLDVLNDGHSGTRPDSTRARFSGAAASTEFLAALREVLPVDVDDAAPRRR